MERNQFKHTNAPDIAVANIFGLLAETTRTDQIFASSLYTIIGFTSSYTNGDQNRDTCEPGSWQIIFFK